MSRAAFVALAALVLGACSSTAAAPSPVEASIRAVVRLPEGGIAVDFDVRGDGRDLVLALLHPSRPGDVASTLITETGPERRLTFSPEDVGDLDDAALERLVAVIRDGQGTVWATRQAP